MVLVSMTSMLMIGTINMPTIMMTMIEPACASDHRADADRLSHSDSHPFVFCEPCVPR
jgi:hypothetical protein